VMIMNIMSIRDIKTLSLEHKTIFRARNGLTNDGWNFSSTRAWIQLGCWHLRNFCSRHEVSQLKLFEENANSADGDSGQMDGITTMLGRRMSKSRDNFKTWKHDEWELYESFTYAWSGR
jgi:hypothetical protein